VSFGERFREAAEAARANIINHEALRYRTAAHGVHDIELQPQDYEVARRAMRLGAPDPYSLITHDEVVALTGIPVGGPSLTYADDDLGVRFDAEDGHRRMWSFGVHAGHAVSDDIEFNPVSWFEWMVALLDEPEPVPDLGDEAVYDNGLLYVLGEGRAFYVLVDAPQGSATKKVWATALARRVLERFATGEAG
jgi:hypothetical protein